MTEPLEESEEQRLRRSLALIAEEAGRDEARDAPPVRRLRRRLLAGGVAAAAAACAAVLAVVLTEGADPVATDAANDTAADAEGGGEAGGDAAGRALTGPESVACAETIVEGEVTAVEEAGEPHHLVLTLTVTDWIKPDSGEEETRLTVLDPAHVDRRNAVEPGAHILAWVYPTDHGDTVTQGEEEVEALRASLLRDLPDAADTPCPEWWSDPDPADT